MDSSPIPVKPVSAIDANYYNYFTEIEEHFQRQRGARIYLSPVDWALIESWREAGIPLAAVLEGIERAFEKFARGRRSDLSRPRALVYCAPAVLAAARAHAAAAEGGPDAHAASAAEAAAANEFAPARLASACAAWRKAWSEAVIPPGAETARQEGLTILEREQARLHALAAEEPERGAARPRLEEFEHLLTALEDKLAAALLQLTPADLLARMRGELDGLLAPYRRKLQAAQLTALEPRFLRQRLFEHYRLPRLSLFHLPADSASPPS